MGYVRYGFIGILLCLSHAYVNAQAQGGCAQDALGKTFCAPPGGTAVQTLNGVACAPGRCVTDNLGYLKCSNQLGGGATTDNLGRVICVGQCVNPSKQYCNVTTHEEKK